MKNLEDYQITEFFDELGNQIGKLKPLKNEEKEDLIKTLLGFLNEQEQDLEENWSLIHLVESVDSPEFKLYDKLLIKEVKASPNLTNVFLLNRLINPQESVIRLKNAEILKKISIDLSNSELVREQAKEFLEHQLEQ